MCAERERERERADNIQAGSGKEKNFESCAPES